jgi:hypothetical protein
MHGPNDVKLELYLQNGGVHAELNTVERGSPRVLRSGVNSPLMTDGAWHHLAMTRAPDGIVSLYVDGARVAVEPASETTNGALETTARSFGCRRTSEWNRPVGYLGGTLDEVAFFNRSLSAEEVARLSRLNLP